jgi:hypothetical protein
LDSENGFQAKKKRKMLAVLVPPRGVAAIKHGTSPMVRSKPTYEYPLVAQLLNGDWIRFRSDVRKFP